MSEIHELKTLPNYWEAVKRGDKTFEVRRDDRGFQKGDLLRLAKFEDGYYVPPEGQRFGKQIIERRISYVLTGGRFGIEPGFVVLALEPLPTQTETDAHG